MSWTICIVCINIVPLPIIIVAFTIMNAVFLRVTRFDSIADRRCTCFLKKHWNLFYSSGIRTATEAPVFRIWIDNIQYSPTPKFPRFLPCFPLHFHCSSEMYSQQTSPKMRGATVAAFDAPEHIRIANDLPVSVITQPDQVSTLFFSSLLNCQCP